MAKKLPEATNKDCYFYDESYAEKCRACKICDCNHCALFKSKNDPRENKLQLEFRNYLEMSFYSNGVRR